MVNPTSVVDQEIPKSKSSSPESQARDDNYKEEENKKVEEVDKAGEGDGEEEEEEEENRQIVRRLPEQQQQQQQQQGGGGGGGTPSLDPNQTYILAGEWIQSETHTFPYYISLPSPCRPVRPFRPPQPELRQLLLCPPRPKGDDGHRLPSHDSSLSECIKRGCAISIKVKMIYFPDARAVRLKSY